MLWNHCGHPRTGGSHAGVERSAGRDLHQLRGDYVEESVVHDIMILADKMS